MFRTGFLTLRRGFPTKVLSGSSRYLSTGKSGSKISSQTHVKKAATALTAGALLGLLVSGSFIGLETPAGKPQSEKAITSPAKTEAPSPETKSTQEAANPDKKDEEDDKSKPQSAYDPDTGVINWDCPCLGGMAQGPCGEEFKAAFSCFVYSEEDPKGIDCIEKFKGMQECFRKYPEYYAEQIKDEEEAAHVAQNLESRNDQDQMIDEVQNVHPEESTPILQQKADFSSALDSEETHQVVESKSDKEE
ncbi:LAME_0E08262g1_1 [Lachancea meyersii CBS 8951]|uniref:Mitochondrial intermembrane space import and assembly protein 40 n=1 Tax=Lachancea meyersii CBS 8951 TaxID=1266667 RepID=A0A1G4JIS7_9SACH|nr:LAME_0E08262g1_1 [Lachancea meyersii CBS 8951]